MYKTLRFLEVQENWEIEVENVAADLVDAGVPPSYTLRQAESIVSTRRSRAKGGNKND